MRQGYKGVQCPAASARTLRFATPAGPLGVPKVSEKALVLIFDPKKGGSGPRFEWIEHTG